MQWDSDQEIKRKHKDFSGGESLVEFKEFIANLPDQLPANYTARLDLELVINNES